MEFVNALASYIVLMLVIAAVGAVAIFIGITLRKRKNAKAAALDNAESVSAEG